MNNRILFPLILATLNACSTSNPMVGEWLPDDIEGELLLSKQSQGFQVSLTSKGENQGIYPAEVNNQGFTFTADNTSLGSTQYHCSLTTNQNEMNCNLVTTTIFGNQTEKLRLVRKK